MSRRIWVDADACPKPVKEILFRAAVRTAVPLVLVANQALHVPPSPHIRAVQVAKGFDVADDEIVRRVGVGDLVITADIPLAAEVIGRGGVVLTPRGEYYDRHNIQAALTMRNFMDTLRSSGVETGGPAAFSPGDRQAFASRLDKWLLAGR